MTTTFPPKPWTEGAVFINETTGVSYTYNGSRWLASGGPEVEGQYLPLTGGTIDGELHVKKSKTENIFDVKADSVQYQRHATSFTQLHPREIINTGILDNLMRDPGKYGYLYGYATEEYVDNAIGGIDQGGSTWNTSLDGEYSSKAGAVGTKVGHGEVLLLDQNGVATTRPSEIIYIALNENMVDWDTKCGWAGIIKIMKGDKEHGTYWCTDHDAQPGRHITIKVLPVEYDNKTNIAQGAIDLSFRGMFLV